MSSIVSLLPVFLPVRALAAISSFISCIFKILDSMESAVTNLFVSGKMKVNSNHKRFHSYSLEDRDIFGLTESVDAILRLLFQLRIPMEIHQK